jgi:secreted PhoX family phosphatase
VAWVGLDEMSRRRDSVTPGTAAGAGGLTRRGILKGGAALGIAFLAPGCVRGSAPLAGERGGGLETAPGYVHDLVLRWGDPLFPGTPPLDAAAALEGRLLDIPPALAERWFGYNCDAVHYFPLEATAGRGLLCVNHEYTNEELFLPGASPAYRDDGVEPAAFVARHPQLVPLTQAMNGVSVVVVEKSPGGGWRHVPGQRQTRRITPHTPCEITGPARGHPLLRTAADPAGVTVLGTVANCAGGQTPWGTFLSAEENVQYFFGNGLAIEAAAAEIREAHRRFPPRRASRHGWEHGESRFDLGRSPTEMLRFGWVVEIDPYDPVSVPRKRTALGRFQHECAAAALTKDGRVAVYSGDDSRFEYVYKFVSRDRVHATDRAANRDLLDHGTLYVARFDADGTGEWLPLVHGQGPLVPGNGFANQADVVIKVRAAADLLGATPMDRPEDIAPDAETGRVFVALTNNGDRAAVATPGTYSGRELDLGPNAANPRGPNPFGHVVEIREEGADTAATHFAWRIFLAGGPAAPGVALGSPDNLDLGRNGDLWIVTDGAQPGGGRNGCFVVPTAGPDAGRATQVMSAPTGSEISGCAFVPDGTGLLLTIMHPGDGGNLEPLLSSWPDGPGHVPRPSLVALRRDDGRVM